MPNPVDYAENVLGVNAVWEESQAQSDLYETALAKQVDAQNRLRNHRAALADREAEILSEGRAKYAEISATAFEKVYRELIHDDRDHKSLRAQERELEFDLDVINAEVNGHRNRLRQLAARMNELGGLLAFYAVTKSQQVRS